MINLTSKYLYPVLKLNSVALPMKSQAKSLKIYYCYHVLSNRPKIANFDQMRKKKFDANQAHKTF
jgi:hypothetical protein